MSRTTRDQRTPDATRRSRALTAAGTGLAFGALLVTATSGVAHAASGSPLRVVEEDIAYTVPGAVLSFTAPAWATHATITLAGAAGGDTCVSGGRGTEVTVTTEVRGGESFSLALGENGQNARGNKRSGSGATSVSDEDDVVSTRSQVGATGADVVVAGGWGPADTNGGSATWRDQAAAVDHAIVASGGGGSELRLDGKTVVLAGGGGGAGACASATGGRGGTSGSGANGSDFGLLSGGSGGGYATSHLRAGDAAVNAGGGGGGSKGGGYGSSGQSTLFNVVAGSGGGGAGGSWAAPGMRWDGSTAADSSRPGSYAKVVFANRDLRATGNLALGRPVNASSSLEHASFAARVLTDGFTRSEAGNNAYASDPARPTVGDGTTVQEWVEVDLGQAQTVSSVRLYPRTTASDDSSDVTGAGFPQAFTVDVSTDGQSWTRVGSFTGQANVTEPRTYDLTSTSARWVRLNVTTLGPVAAGDYGHRLQLAELEIYR